MAKLGFIGLGTMGSRVVKRLLDAGHQVTGYNRTRAKAEPLAAAGAALRGAPAELAAVDVLFTMVATGKDLEQVLFGPGGVVAGGGGAVPRIVVDCSSIGVDQGQAIRARLAEQVVRTVQRLRSEEDLLKPPGVSETLDWARALHELGTTDLDLETTAATVGVAVKYQEDAQRVRAALDRILGR